MKKIFTVSSLLILSVVFLAACTRRGGNYGDDEDYWLSRERGIVVYSDDYCPYYVVETYYGYTVIEAMSGYSPYEGDIIYGDLSRIGYMELYNRSAGTITRGDVVDYWLTYGEAQFLIDDLCYYGKSSDKKIKAAGTVKEQKTKPKVD